VSEKRVRAYRHGLLAETIAALLLRLKGHRIIARRYKTPVGEIDLVALKGKRLAFVEVKQRKTFDEAGWSLPTRARRRIVRAAHIGLPATPTSPATTSPSTWYWPRLGRCPATSPTRSRCNRGLVIAGLDPAIHSNGAPTDCSLTEWMPGSSPGMTM
jgi:putative endonuclease